MNGTVQSSRVVILVKALPNPSTKHQETVCCAGVTLDGQWKRLFPIRFRQLSDQVAFKRWDWVEFQYSKSSDPRVESCRVHEESINRLSPLHKNERAAFLDRMIIGSANEAASLGKSLALIRPRDTLFHWVKKTDQELEGERQHFSEVSRQKSLIDPELAKIEPTPYKFYFNFTDNSGKHQYENGDWESHAMFAK